MVEINCQNLLDLVYHLHGDIVSVIAGLFIPAALYAELGIDAENVPVLVILILWAVFSTIAAVVVDKIGL